MQKCRPKRVELELAYQLEPSTSLVGEHYGVTRGTILKWLKLYGVSTRSESEAQRAMWAQHPHSRYHFTKGELEKPYKAGKSTKDIAREFGVSSRTIIDWMIKYGIPRRTRLDALKQKGIRPPGCPLEKYARKYIIPISLASRIAKLYLDGSTIYQIAPSFNLSPSAVYQSLLRSKVKCRNASERTKLLWANPQWAKRQVVLASKGAMRRPTKPERRLLRIINKFGLPYKYTGDGSFIIGSLNPDFVNCNGAKIALEVFGDYWHTTGARGRYALLENRRAKMAEYGWGLLIFWQSEMDKLTDKEIVERLSESQNKDKEVICRH